MNAVTLEVLLHYYYKCIDIEIESESIQKALDELCASNMLGDFGTVTVKGTRFVITDKGKVYIDHLLSIPIPVEKTSWVIPTKEGS